MKSLLRTLGFLLLAGTTFGETVLTLVDEKIHDALRKELTEWRDQVQQEGFFQVDLRVVPRVSSSSPKRFAQLQAHRALVEEVKPAAVQIFGSVAIGIAGWHAADGHEPRCAYTDAPYMIALNSPLTDDRDFGVNRSQPGWSNMAGDRRWDQNLLDRYERPAARVNFAELSLVLPNMRVPTGCLKGKPICPAVDELAAFKNYLKRNLEYRRGMWTPPREGWLQGPLWSARNDAPRKFAKTQMPQFHWRDIADPADAAGKDVFLLFNNCDRDHLYQFADINCRWVRAVWANSYRSFTMEQFASAGVIRRWLQYALISTWGPNWWVIPPSAKTVGDAITATARHQRHWEMLFTVAGDVTLPLQPITAAASSGQANP